METTNIDDDWYYNGGIYQELGEDQAQGLTPVIPTSWVGRITWAEELKTSPGKKQDLISTNRQINK